MAQRKNLIILGLPKRKKWPQCHKVSSWQVRQAVFAKRKRNRVACPDHEVGESQGERETYLDEIEGDQSGRMGRKEWTPQSRKADSREEREGKQGEFSKEK